MTGYPKVKYRFQLEIDGLSAGEFSEVSGFDAYIEPIEYREGMMAIETPLQAAGLRKYGNITLKNGVIEGQKIHDWLLSGQTTAMQR